MISLLNEIIISNGGFCVGSGSLCFILFEDLCEVYTEEWGTYISRGCTALCVSEFNCFIQVCGSRLKALLRFGFNRIQSFCNTDGSIMGANTGEFLTAHMITEGGCDFLHEGFQLRLPVAQLLQMHLQQMDENKARVPSHFHPKNVHETAVAFLWVCVAPPSVAQEAPEAQP